MMAIEPTDLLTLEELEALDHLSKAAGILRRITLADSAYPYDWQEAAAAIHVLQRMILSQAAGRAMPERFRLLGNAPKRLAGT